MLQVERQEEILQLLKSHQALRVSQLAKLLYTSEATVRRDLAALERNGTVRRVFGGVVAVQEQLPLDFRRQKNAAGRRWSGTGRPCFWTPLPPRFTCCRIF